MNILKRSKILLVSSPGLDQNSQKRTGGYNPVTPRFLEGAINYCFELGHFAINSDFKWFNIDSIAENATTISSLSDKFDNIISKQFNYNNKETFNIFLENHFSSTRAKYLLEKLNAQE